MELALEAPFPAALLGSTSAIVVNLPAPDAYAMAHDVFGHPIHPAPDIVLKR